MAKRHHNPKKIRKFIIASVLLTAIGGFIYQYANTIGSVLSFTGYVGVIGLYFIHFAQKRFRSKLDIVKLIWVVLTYMLILVHFIFPDLPTDLEYLTTPLLWYGAYLFYRQKEDADSDRKKAGW